MEKRISELETENAGLQTLLEACRQAGDSHVNRISELEWAVRTLLDAADINKVGRAEWVNIRTMLEVGR